MGDTCRCGRVKDMGGEGFFQINDTVHTSPDIGGARGFCGSRARHDISEMEDTIERLREEWKTQNACIADQHDTIDRLREELASIRPRGRWFIEWKAKYDALKQRAETAEANVKSLTAELHSSTNKEARLRADLSTGGKVCHWQPDAELIYHTDCGHDWQFTADGLQENEAEYCPFCGGSIEEWVTLDELKEDGE